MKRGVTITNSRDKMNVKIIQTKIGKKKQGLRIQVWTDIDSWNVFYNRKEKMYIFDQETSSLKIIYR